MGCFPAQESWSKQLPDCPRLGNGPLNCTRHSAAFCRESYQQSKASFCLAQNGSSIKVYSAVSATTLASCGTPSFLVHSSYNCQRTPQHMTTALMNRPPGAVVRLPALVSKSTLQTWLRKKGLFSCWAAGKPLLTSVHIAARLAFAQQHAVYDWSKVVFSDEKMFRIRQGGKVRCWRRRGRSDKVHAPHCD